MLTVSDPELMATQGQHDPRQVRYCHMTPGVMLPLRRHQCVCSSVEQLFAPYVRHDAEFGMTLGVGLGLLHKLHSGSQF